MHRPGLILLLTLSICSLHAQAAWQDKVSPSIERALRTGHSQNVLVLLDDTNLPTPVAQSLFAISHLRERRKETYRYIKELVQRDIPGTAQITLRRDYPSFPIQYVTIHNYATLTQLASHPRVRGIYENLQFQPVLVDSAPLVGTPAVQTIGFSGQGTSIVVLDTGVDYTKVDFGSCTAPGTPSSCRVILAQDYAPNDLSLDSSGHGTLVSAVVAGIAPAANLIVFDVFNGTNASSNDIIAAMEWAYNNQSTYNIVSINLSLGDGSQHATPCAASNPFTVPIDLLRTDVGILTSIASGNNGYSNGLNLPACTPGAISVGAVYDANNLTYSSGTCTDTSSLVDQITCFSNSASYLSLLAPGSLITANYGASGGTGTSFSSPFAAAAIATLRSAFPTLTANAIESRLQQSRKLIIDNRNGVATPRLDILDALGAVNDDFNSAMQITADSGLLQVVTRDADKEPGEPDHAGQTGGASVWFSWTAQTTGFVTFNTNNSDFDTVLGIYTGTLLNNLVEVVSDNNNGGTSGASQVTFYVTANTQYFIAVDGVNATTGTLFLSWNYPTQPAVNEEIPMLPNWIYALFVQLLLMIAMWKHRDSRTRHSLSKRECETIA